MHIIYYSVYTAQTLAGLPWWRDCQEASKGSNSLSLSPSLCVCVCVSCQTSQATLGSDKTLWRLHRRRLPASGLTSSAYDETGRKEARDDHLASSHGGSRMRPPDTNTDGAGKDPRCDAATPYGVPVASVTRTYRLQRWKALGCCVSSTRPQFFETQIETHSSNLLIRCTSLYNCSCSCFRFLPFIQVL